MTIYIVTKSNASNTEKHIIRAFTDKAKAHDYCEAQSIPALYDYEATELEEGSPDQFSPKPRMSQFD